MALWLSLFSLSLVVFFFYWNLAPRWLCHISCDKKVHFVRAYIKRFNSMNKMDKWIIKNFLVKFSWGWSWVLGCEARSVRGIKPAQACEAQIYPVLSVNPNSFFHCSCQNPSFSFFRWIGGDCDPLLYHKEYLNKWKNNCLPENGEYAIIRVFWDIDRSPEMDDLLKLIFSQKEVQSTGRASKLPLRFLNHVWLDLCIHVN